MVYMRSTPTWSTLTDEMDTSVDPPAISKTPVQGEIPKCTLIGMGLVRGLGVGWGGGVAGTGAGDSAEREGENQKLSYSTLLDILVNGESGENCGKLLMLVRRIQLVVIPNALE